MESDLSLCSCHGQAFEAFEGKAQTFRPEFAWFLLSLAYVAVADCHSGPGPSSVQATAIHCLQASQSVRLSTVHGNIPRLPYMSTSVAMPQGVQQSGAWVAAGVDEMGAAVSEGSSSSTADKQAGLTHAVSGAQAVPNPGSINSASLKSASKDGKSGAASPKLPDVATLLDTMRKRLEALNGPALPRI